MGKKGLHFIGNKKPLNNETFLQKKRYRYVPNFQEPGKIKRNLTTFIELEIYQYKICVISFYNKGFGTGRKKYRVRCGLGSGHIKAIVRACLEAYQELIEKEGHHAFVFTAADDLGEHKEYNKRYSFYTWFIAENLPDREKYEEDGSIQLNTYKLVHKDYEFKAECDKFYTELKLRIQDEINNPVDNDAK